MGSVSPQLSWTHYRYLIEIDNEKERAFYQHKTIIHSWSVRELQKSIYALDGLEEKIFIAKYKVKLPSERKIKKAIRKFWNT